MKSKITKRYNSQPTKMRILKKIMAMGLVLCGTYLSAQTTAIPDANFEQALIDLGLDTGTTDGMVPTVNIDTLTYLDVSARNITNLIGIADFIALENLYCSNNQLTSLHLSQNTALTTLWCYINQLTSLDVTQNTALIHLYCNDNHLTSIDLTQNTALTRLDFNNNQLTTLDVSQNTALINLDCNNNQLSSLDISQNTALKGLGCWNNLLTDLDLTQNTALIGLSCEGNSINSIDVTQNTALEHLYCTDNQLNIINVSQNTALIGLQCKGNTLTNLDLTQNTTLTELICDSNQLECLNVNNGNNANFTDFKAVGNPNLTCITVDDAAYSAANWTNIDPQTSFSNNCANPCTVGIAELPKSTFSIAPNPASDVLNIASDGQLNSVTIYTINGQVVTTIANPTQNEIDVSHLTKGMYIIAVQTNKGVAQTKFVKE